MAEKENHWGTVMLTGVKGAISKEEIEKRLAQCRINAVVDSETAQGIPIRFQPQGFDKIVLRYLTQRGEISSNISLISTTKEGIPLADIPVLVEERNRFEEEIALYEGAMNLDEKATMQMQVELQKMRITNQQLEGRISDLSGQIASQVKTATNALDRSGSVDQLMAANRDYVARIKTLEAQIRSNKPIVLQGGNREMLQSIIDMYESLTEMNMQALWYNGNLVADEFSQVTISNVLHPKKRFADEQEVVAALNQDDYHGVRRVYKKIVPLRNEVLLNKQAGAEIMIPCETKGKLVTLTFPNVRNNKFLNQLAETLEAETTKGNGEYKMLIDRELHREYDYSDFTGFGVSPVFYKGDKRT